MKVLFYTHNLRAFRVTLIGYLYEIAQVHSTVLLSEELDSETEAALKNRELFPKLEKVITVGQFSEEKSDLLIKNRYLYRLAKSIIQQCRPDVVISASDTASLFELYLMRFAKRTNALIITIQSGPTFTDRTITTKFVDLTNAYLRFPSFLPLWFRLFLTQCRKYLGHFLYYWILPIMVGGKPFFGKSSFVLRNGLPGMRDSDYQILFSKEDYRIYRDTYLKYGTSVEKLYILSHPLTRETREFFERAYFNKFKKYEKDTKIVSLMLETSVGFKRKDYSLISRKERKKTWIEIIKLTSQILPEWKIYIKPHPDTKNFDEIKESFESISNNIEVVNPQEPADKYIEIGDIIIGLPLSASTTLFTASFQCPGKPIISLDFHQEILGDTYKKFPGIQYVDNKEDFLSVLNLIRENKFRKRKDFAESNDEKLETVEFLNSIEMLEYLFQKIYKNER